MPPKTNKKDKGPAKPGKDVAIKVAEQTDATSKKRVMKAGRKLM